MTVRRGGTNWRGVLARLAATMMLVAGAAVWTASPAAAAYTFTGQFQNFATGMCLDTNSAGSIYTLPCQAGNSWQTWTVSYADKAPSGYDRVTIRNRQSGLCLDMWEYGGPQQHANPCNGGLRQLIEGYGPNWNQVSLRLNFFDTRYICVDTHGSGDAYARACNYGSFQTWRLNGR
ncbi:RICIN domain-containing protein [Micromonospora matsumotoense]|uniref:RICIN domain-containing protein n=1 Tax=Micromonospora matsumotoense TaxID=121616 RepID=UPI003D94DFF2